MEEDSTAPLSPAQGFCPTCDVWGCVWLSRLGQPGMAQVGSQGRGSAPARPGLLTLGKDRAPVHPAPGARSLTSAQGHAALPSEAEAGRIPTGPLLASSVSPWGRPGSTHCCSSFLPTCWGTDRDLAADLVLLLRCWRPSRDTGPLPATEDVKSATHRRGYQEEETSMEPAHSGCAVG